VTINPTTKNNLVVAPKTFKHYPTNFGPQPRQLKKFSHHKFLIVQVSNQFFWGMLEIFWTTTKFILVIGLMVVLDQTNEIFLRKSLNCFCFTRKIVRHNEKNLVIDYGDRKWVTKNFWSLIVATKFNVSIATTFTMIE
jgi:hypothetical protein